MKIGVGLGAPSVAYLEFGKEGGMASVWSVSL